MSVLNNIAIFLIVLLFPTVIYSQKPETPEVISVNVINDNSVSLTWSISDPSKVDGYRIYRLYQENDGAKFGYNTIDSVASNIFTYVDNSGTKPSVRFESYLVDSYRIDPTTGDKEYSLISTPHNTLYLKDISYTPCESGRKIHWNSYLESGNGWPTSEFSHYNVVRMFPSGATDQNFTTNDTLYIDKTSNILDEYKYYVEAVKSSGEISRSNIRTASASSFQNPPAWIEISNLSVENNDVKLSSKVASDSQIEKFKLFIKSDSGDSFTSKDSLTGNIFDLNFLIKNVSTQSKVFYISAINECGKESTSSDTISNIVLESDHKLKSVDVNLSWSSQTAINGDIEVQRFVNGTFDRIVSTTTAGSFTDNISGNLFDNIEYVLKNIRNNSDSGIDTEIYSNRVKVSPVDGMVVPNSFIPNDDNPRNTIFKPVLFNPKSLKFVVYNGQGRMVFHSNGDNVHAGWDGYINGNLAPAGTYLYYIEFEDNNGKVFKKKGSLLLILKD